MRRNQMKSLPRSDRLGRAPRQASGFRPFVETLESRLAPSIMLMLARVQPAPSTLMVTLNWTDTSTSVYQPQRCPNEDFMPADITNLPPSGGQSITDTVPTAGTYCYRIQGTHDDGLVEYSNILCPTARAADAGNALSSTSQTPSCRTSYVAPCTGTR